VDDRLGGVPVVADFAASVSAIVQVEAVYAAGSLASGDYQAASSDLDLVAVVAAPFAAGQRAQLRRFHRAFRRDRPEAAKLHCTYLPRERTADPVCRHMTWSHGRMHRRRLSVITRAELLRFGITVLGPPPADFFSTVEKDELQAVIRADLAGFWASAVRRRWEWRRDDYVDLGLLTIARAEAALTSGELITKTQAIEQLHRRALPDELIGEIEQRHAGAHPTLTLHNRLRRGLLVRREVADGIRRLVP
jgi:hypothetical protein